MPDLSGRRIGNYQLSAKIGQGGMAVVYQGRHVVTGEMVAVKVLSSQAPDEANFDRRFRREARVLMDLKHPHIVPVTDFGEVDDVAYLVMPYLRVGSLAQRMAERPIAAVEGGRVFGEIASALAYAHEKGVVHRDVKPSNVLLTEEGQALLSDFGLAQIHDASVSLTGSMMLGTPAYVSPEMVRGEPVDARADQYALGIILFEMTTARLPFNAETPMAILVKQANEPLPRPREIRANIPEAVERVILRATAKNPQDRFASVTEMNNAFQAALAHALDPQHHRAPTIALPQTAVAKARVPEEKRRRRRWAALVPALLLLLACPVALAMRDVLLPPAQGASAYTDLSAPQLTALSGTISALSTLVVANAGETLSPEEVASRVAAMVGAPTATPTPWPVASSTGEGSTTSDGSPTQSTTPPSGATHVPTFTRTPGPTATLGPSATGPTPTQTDEPSNTPEPPATTPPPSTSTPTPTRTPTATNSGGTLLPPTWTATPTRTPTRTPTVTITGGMPLPTQSPSPSKTPTPTKTPTPNLPTKTPTVLVTTPAFPPTLAAPTSSPPPPTVEGSGELSADG